MRNRKGITLIEVLASVTILAIALLAIVYMLQQTTLFSKKNIDKENNVQVARTVMEEIKVNLKEATPRIAPFGSTIDLAGLKGSAEVSLTPFYSSSSQAVKIDVKSKVPTTSVSIKGTSYPIRDYFRLIQVTCTNVNSNDKPYSLEAYVEISAP